MSDERLRLIAELQNKASAELRRLQKDMSGVKPTHGMVAAQTWFETFRGTADKTAQVVKPISGYMGAIGVGGLAAGFSLAELVKQFKELAGQTLALKEIGRQTGLTATEVKQLQYAASQLNVDPSKMVAGLQVMSNKMYDFRRHVGDLYGEINQFDPDFARKLALDGPEQQLKDIIALLTRIHDPQLQRRWAEAFFGDADMARLAAIPGEFSQAWADAAQKVAPVTAELEQQAKLLNQSINDFDRSWDSFKTEVGPTVFRELRLAADDFRSAFDEVKAASGWFEAHQAHPFKDAAKAADENFNVHAAEAGQRYRGEKPWGIGLPKAWTDDLGLTDPNKPWDGSYSIDFHRLGSGGRGEDGNALHRNDEMPVGPAARTPASLYHPSAYVPDGTGQPVRHLVGTLRTAAAKAAASGITPAAFHPAMLGGVSTLDPVQAIAAGTKDGFLAAYRELASGVDGAGPPAGSSLTPAAFHPGGGGWGSSGGAGSRSGLGGGGHGPGGSGGPSRADGDRTAPTAGGAMPSAMPPTAYQPGDENAKRKDVEGYIRARAASMGIDPDTAVKVAMSEGLRGWDTGRDGPRHQGDFGTSFGAFQLHYGGSGIPGMNARGLGDDFTRDTHLDARDPKTWRAQVDYALQRARSHGWTDWHGAANIGIGRWQGIGTYHGPVPGAGSVSPSAGPKGAYPEWMDARSRREMAGINAPLARDLLSAAGAAGVHFRILQGMRSEAEARANARSGRGVANSQHRWGAAADVKLTDAQGHDLDRMDPAYERFANAYEAASRGHGGGGRWLGHVAGWKWDRAHFDQGVGYGQSHARDPYGSGGPTADDIAAGNREIFNGPDNPFLRAAHSELIRTMPNLMRLARRDDGDARRAAVDPLRIDIHHHQDGRVKSIRASGGRGAEVRLARGPTFAAASETS